MASSSSFFTILLIFTSFNKDANGCYTSIISFGDSLADTGNLKQIYATLKRDSPHFFFPPYGETFFHNVTGRCSNDRLIIDFIAETLGVLRISPYQKIKTSNMMELGQGINFAVIGATALDSSFHEARGVYNPFTNASLSIQLKWFKELLPSICDIKSDCKNLLHNSLILMGEIGGNDYNHPIIAGKPFDELKSYVPLVIDTIESAIHNLIDLGAQTLVVPGNLPIGCSAAYLAIYYGSDKVQFDNATGCLIHLNEFSEYHNRLLQMALNRIRELHPNVNVIYADYYNAAMQFYRSPQEYGFTNGALSACCGGGGPYNYNELVQCADPSSTTCDHPETYANWDGLHLTEAAYHIIYKSLFQGTYTTPQFSTLCPASNVQTEDSLSSNCKSLLHNSLILMGEIGGNDYNHPIIAGKPFDELISYIPLVIDTIESAIHDLIDLGAQTLVVPGNLPIGCSAAYLAIYYDSDKAQIDNATGCLIQLNDFAEYHNGLLQMALNRIRELHPNVNVVYADYYNAAMQFYRSPQEYGFTNGALSTCCGGGGPYNYNELVQCGDPSSTTCDQPKTYANWDGLHLTEAAYHIIYKSLFQGTYTTPQFNTLCPASNVQTEDSSSSSSV
ncbi:hypothetical protein SSX86_015660 [Deinandra increscens subsp. villosa]|uniref:Uncharacterized protein n=1 Tax=Deinandra increscens subsp. villosa TaxID=3103831 RepID=A0AAP0D177_9ASTR